MLDQVGRLPDVVVACVGGGSNAIGIFDGFLDDTAVRLIGVEAGGERIAPGRHAARFAGGSTGVLQGTRTFVLQDEAGNIELTHSISAGLDYAAVGPEHAWLRDLGRTEYALRHGRRGARRLSRRSRGSKASCRRSSRRTRLRTRCGSRTTLADDRSDPRQPVGPRRQGRAERGGGASNESSRSRRFARLRETKTPGLVTYVTAGDPDSAAHSRRPRGARSRRRRRARSRRAVLGSARRRSGDPARDRAGAGVGHDADAASSICCGRVREDICGRRS